MNKKFLLAGFLCLVLSNNNTKAQFGAAVAAKPLVDLAAVLKDCCGVPFGAGLFAVPAILLAAVCCSGRKKAIDKRS